MVFPKLTKNTLPFHLSDRITDTTGTGYLLVAMFLRKLVNLLTVNDYSLTDSFDAASRINSIPSNLFNDGYRFVSFDVKSLLQMIH